MGMGIRAAIDRNDAWRRYQELLPGLTERELLMDFRIHGEIVGSAEVDIMRRLASVGVRNACRAELRRRVAAGTIEALA